MHNALDGFPQCKHCLWQFKKHFAHNRCPALHVPDPSSAETHGPSAAIPALGVTTEMADKHLNGNVQLQPPPPVQQEHPLQQLDSDLIRLACDPDWKPLAQYFRRSDQHHCPFCNQWLARPTYLSRHLCKQHGSIFQYHERAQQWLTERSTALGQSGRRGKAKGALAVAGPEAATGRTRAKRTTRRSGTRIGKRRRRTPGIRSRGCKPSPIASSGSYAG